MSDTSTVRVQKSTRDLLNQISRSRHETVDETIRHGLEAMVHAEWIKQAVLDARAAASDEADRAEIASVLRDLGE